MAVLAEVRKRAISRAWHIQKIVVSRKRRPLSCFPVYLTTPFSCILGSAPNCRITGTKKESRHTRMATAGLQQLQAVGTVLIADTADFESMRILPSWGLRMISR